MDPNTRALIMGAAGVSGEKIYVEDVFSTWLYTGTGATQTITNGIDLSGKGGLTWIKGRSGATGHRFTDTARGATKSLDSASTAAEATESTGLTAFGSTGFTIGADTDYNTNAATYASWTFRKAPKFFDVVTYVGTGANRTIAHNLGSVPGCIIVKRTDTTAAWQVYHRSLANTEYLVLNSTAAKATGATRWNSTTPTSTVFSLGTDATVNDFGGAYVAYVFAHDAGGFGDSGNDSVVKCGSYTGNGSSTGPVVDLGWEPQWVMVKAASTTGDWFMADTMRGQGVSGSTSQQLAANTTDQEMPSNFIAIKPTGFQLTAAVIDKNGSGQTYIYIAIRRGPMKTPTDATKVFHAYAGADNTAISTGFSVDAFIDAYRPGGFANTPFMMSRLTNLGYLRTSNTTAEQVSGNSPGFDSNTTVTPSFWGADTSVFSFRRAPGFFDVVAYAGTGSATTVAHNLGVAPELMIIKRRGAVENWQVYSQPTGASAYLTFTTAAVVTGNTNRWNATTPTSSVFSIGTAFTTDNYIAYLFATLAGVSKVGSYTGTGTTLQVNCGFTAGARFVMIKRTDSTGDWYVWDTARGIVSGNDSYLLLNSTAAEVTNTDYIDPLSSGFEISSTAPAAINASGGTFIYLAIA